MTLDEAYQVLRDDESCKMIFNSEKRSEGATNVFAWLDKCAKETVRLLKTTQEIRRQILSKNTSPCPCYDLAKEKNRYVHNSCSFLCMTTQPFCKSCKYYLDNIQGVDLKIEKLRMAIDVFMFHSEEAKYHN